MDRKLIRNNVASFAIVLFIVLFIIFQITSPSFLYDSDGGLRVFGLGTKKKTILPIWLLTIFLAILSYLFVLYYLSFNKLY